MPPAPFRLLALTAAAVLAGGVVVAVTAPGEARTAPVASPRADIKALRSPSPRPTPTPTPTASKERATPAATASPARTRTVAQPLFPLPARAAYPQPCPPPPIPPGPPFKAPRPTVKWAELPRAVSVPEHRHVNIHAVTGKGIWLTTWSYTRINPAQVVTRATAAGLRQIWVRTGGSSDGWYGERLLSGLLPVAHAAGLKVIAWDFPTLSDPLRDVRRADHVLKGTFAGQHVDGFSPDIETITEGTFNSPRRVRIYLSRVRRDAGSLPVIATVLRPTPAMLASYPYRAEAPYVDVFAPMVYWSCTEPGAATLDAIRPLARLRPVHVIGQSFDMGSMGGRHGLPTGREIWRFLDVAKRAGAVGASLYLYEQTRAPQWRALTQYPWK